ncbi:hypothetical protein N802_08820 [Knoellia sinensis KCTC 19936]|uniref:Uncharacterized protein n=1 Tax=Knoellia sinensis KCTC 19936 TaxID=1385520 RepID=A0A0A0J989_9MICO|nr:hypothetical protein [Knoellia sinensis]KGN33980.1 hypothetical protein N802_08820 [Knoellia sinensis KCTC 19936]
MDGVAPSGRLLLRGTGYLALVVGILASFLIAGVMGFLDPEMDASSDPDWMFWVWSAANAGLLARAPFVGLLIDGDKVVRRGWVRNWTYRAEDVVTVRSRPVPEVGGAGSTARRVKAARDAVGLTVG